MSKTNLLLTTKKTAVYIKKRVKNFPKSERILKENIENNMNELIEFIFCFMDNEKIIIKNKYVKKIVVKIEIIIFYIEMAYKKALITDKRYNDMIRYLEDIKKIAHIILKYNNSIVKGDDVYAI